MGIDPNLAARLQQLGPVSVTRIEATTPAKVFPKLHYFDLSPMI